MKRFLAVCAAAMLILVSCKSSQKSGGDASMNLEAESAALEPMDFSGHTKSGIFSVYLKSSSSKLFARRGAFVLDKASAFAGFASSADDEEHALFFGRPERAALCEAVSKYAAAFDGKLLETGGDNKALYGKVICYESYGKVGAEESAAAKGYAQVLSLGYAFVKKNPYFVISASRPRSSPLRNSGASDVYYLTKLQAQRLSEFLASVPESASR